jgi:hypothetical protein
MSLNRWRRFDSHARVTLLALACGLTGCASQAPLSPGFSTVEVRQRWGEPTSRHVLPQGGIRWEYAKGPEGAVTYMVDFDRNERLATVGQVLTEATFATIAAGQTEEAVRRTIGRPSNVASAGLRGGLIWSYRYETTFCQWFQVVFDADRRVRETGFGNDPRCFPKND